MNIRSSQTTIKRSLLGVFLVSLLSLIFAQYQHTRAASADPATELLGLVNRWRISQNLWPLRPNAILQQMAEAQAAYILPQLESISDESQYHLDAQGRNPRQRAAAAPNNWPNYGSPDRIELGENAAVGSVKFAFGFWQTSDIHAKTALNATYREVGVAVVRYQTGYLFYMDFGARPNVLTGLIDKANNLLYLSEERSRFWNNGKTTQITIADVAGQALKRLYKWQQAIPLPANLAAPVIVIDFKMGGVDVFSQVALDRDLAVLPGNGVPAEVAAEADNAATAVATELAVSTPAATTAPTESATATPVPTAAATATPAGVAGLALIYDKNTLTLINTTANLFDITGLGLRGVEGSIATTSWSNVSPFKPTAFKPLACLQVQVNGANPLTPTDCKNVQSVVILSRRNVFWTSDSFSVLRGAAVIATCSANAGRCNFNW